MSGWGRAHHTDEIPAAVLSHQLLLAAATLDDAAQPPIEHDVGAVGAVALPGVGGGSYRVRQWPRQLLSVEVAVGVAPVERASRLHRRPVNSKVHLAHEG